MNASRAVGPSNRWKNTEGLGIKFTLIFRENKIGRGIILENNFILDTTIVEKYSQMKYNVHAENTTLSQ